MRGCTDNNHTPLGLALLFSGNQALLESADTPRSPITCETNPPLYLLHVKFNSECRRPEIWMMLHQFWLMQFIRIQAIFKASCANKKFISLVLYDLAGKPRCFFLFLFYLRVVILFSTYDLKLCLPD